MKKMNLCLDWLEAIRSKQIYSDSSLSQAQENGKNYYHIYNYITKYARVTPFLYSVQWVTVRDNSMLKMATLVYKFLNSGYPSYFSPFLISCGSKYNTRARSLDGNILGHCSVKSILANI